MAGERADALFDGSRLALAVCTTDGHITRVNAALCSLLGRDAASLQGLAFTALLAPERRGEARDTAMPTALPVGQHDLRLAHADGHVVHVRVSVSRWPAAAEPEAVLVQVEDVSTERRAEERVALLAPPDAMTGLSGGSLFLRDLALQVGRSQRYGEVARLLLVDLDDIAAVNTTYGHVAGDAVIRAVATALSDRLRTTDLLARLGGTQFAILLPGAAGTESVTQTIQRTISGCEVVLDGSPVHVTASVGVAVIDRSTVSPEVALGELRRLMAGPHPREVRLGLPPRAAVTRTGLRTMSRVHRRIGVAAVVVTLAAAVGTAIVAVVGHEPRHAAPSPRRPPSSAPAGPALTFEGFSTWRAPCLLDTACASTDLGGRAGCFGPVDVREMLGRPFTYRFASRRSLVLSEGWTRYQRTIDYLHAFGARVLPVLTTEGLTDLGSPPPVFRAFVRDAIRSLDTDVFQIGNEPNAGESSEFGQRPEAFGNILCAAYEGWRDAGSPPDVAFVTGGLATPSPNAALDYLGRAKAEFDRSCGEAAWSRFSAVGVHLYPPTPYQAAGTVVALHTWLRRHGLQGMGIAITEYAWGSVALGEAEQRDRQIEFQRWARANRRKCDVTLAYWFASRDPIDETAKDPGLIVGEAKGLGLTHADYRPKAVFWSWLAFLGDHSIRGGGIPEPRVTPRRLHLAPQASGPSCRRAHPSGA